MSLRNDAAMSCVFWLLYPDYEGSDLCVWLRVCLLVNVLGLECLGLKCCHGAHGSMAGRSSDSVYRTAGAQEYPKGFCQALGTRFVAHLVKTYAGARA